jgi:hypothetical protein
MRDYEETREKNSSDFGNEITRKITDADLKLISISQCTSSAKTCAENSIPASFNVSADN